MEHCKPLVIDIPDLDDSQKCDSEVDEDIPVDLTIENTDEITEEPSFERKNGSKRTLKSEKPIKVRKLIFSKEDLDKRRRTANHQERSRMKKMSEALERLRTALPDDYKICNRKMSKIRTLTVAIGYIKALGDMIKAHDDASSRVKDIGMPMEQFQVPAMPYSPYMFPSLVSSCGSLQYPDVQANAYGQTVYPSQPVLAGKHFPASPFTAKSTQLFQSEHYPYVHPYYQTPPQMLPGSANDVNSSFSDQSFSQTPVNLRCKYSSPYSRLQRHHLMKTHKPSTFSSPLVCEGRNINELNASFLSVSSDDLQEGFVKRKGIVDKYCVDMDGVYPLPEESESVPIPQINQ